VRATLQWSAGELATLVNAVETMDDGGSEWRRGGGGQSLWSIMVVDPDLCQKLPGAIGICVAAGKLQAALRLVICYQYLADDSVAVVDAMMEEHPRLAEEEMAGYLVEHVHEWGRLDVY
jgi:hypothetical protein